jgi:hypothetical protein
VLLYLWVVLFVGIGFEAPISEAALGLRRKPSYQDAQRQKTRPHKGAVKKAKSAGRSVLVATLEAQ